MSTKPTWVDFSTASETVARLQDSDGTSFGTIWKFEDDMDVGWHAAFQRYNLGIFNSADNAKLAVQKRLSKHAGSFRERLKRKFKRWLSYER